MRNSIDRDCKKVAVTNESKAALKEQTLELGNIAIKIAKKIR
ncbi:hypothetical protein [Tenacibaculum retecalamus]|nr:hypothetical protein [Tenacibaculum retecalamus]WBX71067.1 hypothetical protein PG912_12785 [Tenacibaculum retecalamus]